MNTTFFGSDFFHGSLLRIQYTQVMNKKNLDHLSEEQRYVTQEKGTEAPFTGELLHNKRVALISVYVAALICLAQIQNLIQELDGQAFMM